MHPDQSTPRSHRHAASDSQAHRPEQDPVPADPDRDAAPAATEVEDGARVAEAGNAYVGRTMDDDLKAHPRVTDGDAAVDEDPTTARDD